MTSAEALSELTEHGERALNGFLRRESGEQFTTADLARAARNWLAEHQYLQLPERRLRASVVAARRQHEASILDVAIAKIGHRAANRNWLSCTRRSLPRARI